MQAQASTADLGGINRDVQPELQQDGTYRFALNIRESMNSLAQVENMESNMICAEIPGTIVGTVYLIDKFILFVAGNGTSEIGYFYPNNCTYETIPLSCNLNLSVDHPVSAAYKISHICDDFTIYWTDGYNPVRYLELGKLPDSCEDLNLFNCSSFPIIADYVVNDGGGVLNCGTYQFSIRYRDKNGSTTSFLGITNPIPIIDENFNGTEWRKVDGCKGGTVTNKSITLTFDGLDTDYEFIDIAVIHYSNGVPMHTVLESVPAINGPYTVTNNGLVPIDIAEIIIPFASWNYADLLTVHQNRLLLASVKDKREFNYQPYANDIKVKWKTIKLPMSVAYKDPKTYDYKTFIGDEKYALGIVLDYCDGTSSPAFHIPGPKEEEITCEVFPIKSYLVTPVPGGNAEITYVEYNDLWEVVPENDWNNFFECPKYVWEVFNTAGICSTPEQETEVIEDCGIVTDIKPGNWHIGHMAFSQECEVYPDTRGCDGLPIYPYTYGECDTDFVFKWGYIHDINTIPQGTIFNMSVSPSISIDSIFLTIKDSSGTVLYSQSTLSAIVFDQLLLNAGVTLNVTIVSSTTTLTVSVPIDSTTPNCFNCTPVPFTCMGELQMSNVRHHKFPTRKLEPHFEESIEVVTECNKRPNPDTHRAWENHYIFPFGVEVTDIVIPDAIKDDVIGYQLVFVKRDSTNRSVIGKGVLHNGYYGYNETDEKFYIFPRYIVNSWVNISPMADGTIVQDSMRASAVKLHSPDTSFEKSRLLNPAYFSYEAQLKGASREYGVEFKNVDDEQCCVARYNANLISKNSMYDFVHNSPVENASYIQANTILSGVFEAPYYNMYGESGVIFNPKVRDGITPTIPFKPQDNESEECNPAAVNSRSDNSYFTFNENQGCDDNYSRCVRAYYGALKSYKCNQYESIPKLIYTPLKQQLINKNIAALTYSLISFGDGFINYWAYKRSGGSSGWLDFQEDCFDANDLKLPAYPYNAIIQTICESDFNVDLRHEENKETTYFPKLNNGNVPLDITMDNSIGGLNEDTFLCRFHKNMEKNIFINLGEDNSYLYNRDFIRLTDQKVYTALPLNYDPCECETTNQNTIAASEPAFGVADGWKTFRVNNVVNIPKYTGKLMSIFTMNNNLFAHTQHNLWQISTSQTKIQAEGSSVYLGTGDMFSSTPQYIYASPEGFGGIQQRLGSLLNQLGYWFIDAIGAKLLNLNNSIEVVEKGLIDFLRNNLKFYIQDYIPEYELSTTGKIGWLLGYDYKHSLIFITKKDFDFIDPETFGGTYSENDCVVGKVYNKDGKLVLITDTDCSYSYVTFEEPLFCDKSWTLSYSLIRKQFKSFHSFIPDFYLFDRYNLYTAKEGGVYKHNIEHDYQRYYGTYYPSGIELVTKTPQTTYWDSTSYMEDAYVYNTQYKKETLVNETFNRGYLYNKDQNSGMMSIVQSTDFDEAYMSNAIKDSGTVARVFRGNDLWYYNGFYDFVVDDTIPHNTCNCLDPVDQEPNSAALDTNKPYYNLSPLRSTYIVQRMYWDNEEKFNVKHRLSLLINNTTNVNR